MSYNVLVIVECSEMTCRAKLLEAHTACMYVLIIRLLKLTGPHGLFSGLCPYVCNLQHGIYIPGQFATYYPNATQSRSRGNEIAVLQN